MQSSQLARLFKRTCSLPNIREKILLVIDRLANVLNFGEAVVRADRTFAITSITAFPDRALVSPVECSVQVGDEVVAIFDPDRNPHQLVGDAQGGAHVRRR